jgi:hypothetical protein
VHEGLIPDINVLVKSIRRTTLDRAIAWKYSSLMTKEFWSPPPAGSFKINFNTAIRKQFLVQAAVCRDSKGHIIKAISRINPPRDATYGEALAAQLAAQLAASLVVSLILKNFSLDGDSSVIIAAMLTPAFSQDWHEESVTTSTLSLIPASFL